MAAAPSTPSPASLSTYVADGARIAAILAVWGFLSAFFTYGVADLGLPFQRLVLGLGDLFALAGVLNAALYVFYRTVDHWHTQP